MSMLLLLSINIIVYNEGNGSYYGSGNPFSAPPPQQQGQGKFLGKDNDTGEYIYECPNGNAILINGEIRFTEESFRNYVNAFCA